MQNFRPTCDRIGARYYDADLAFWISVDPARQFWSGYGYGAAPLSGTDPDGNMMIQHWHSSTVDAMTGQKMSAENRAGINAYNNAGSAGVLSSPFALGALATSPVWGPKALATGATAKNAVVYSPNYMRR